jgi:hypothetical protein
MQLDGSIGSCVLQGVAMPGGLEDAQKAAWERDAAFLTQLQDSSAAVTTCRRSIVLV